MAYAVAAYLHFVAIFMLFALLVLEHQLFSQPLDFKRARSLFRTDIAFGIVAGLVLITGAARAVRYGKGMDYYLNNSFFHAKIGLFVVVALLSIYPTVTFLRWRPALKAGQAPTLSPGNTRWVKLVIRAELLALLMIPLLATLMARGLGVTPL
jgi:putative membrane protein